MSKHPKGGIEEEPTGWELSGEGDSSKNCKQLLDIIDFLPDATFVIDRRGKVIAWNHAIEEMTGIPKEDILGKCDYAYSVPFYGVRRPVLIDLVFLGDDKIESSYDYIQRRGNTLFAEVFSSLLYGGRGAYLWGTAAPLFDVEGNVVGAVESIRDITEHKKAEMELQESRERYRMLFNSGNDAIFVHRVTEAGIPGRIIEVNDVACQILAYTREELLDMSHLDFIAPAWLDDVSSIRKKLLAKKSVLFEIVAVSKDGREVLFEINTHLFNFEGQSAVLSIARDITERRRMEDELREKIRELERFNKLMVGRELKMISLKKKIEKLEQEKKRWAKGKKKTQKTREKH